MVNNKEIRKDVISNNKRLDELEKHRDGATAGLSRGEIDKKIDAMAATFGEGFKNGALEDFKRRDIEAIYHKLRAMKYKLSSLSAEVDEALGLFDPLGSYPFRAPEEHNDKLEALDDEVTDGKGN